MKESKWSATHCRALSLLLLVGALSNDSLAAPGDVDLSFDPGSGVNEAVSAFALQPDGKVIILEEFTTVKGLVRHGIARLNADGSADSSFNPGTEASENSSIAVQQDGKMLVGRSIWPTTGSITNWGIFRLNSDKSPDTN